MKSYHMQRNKLDDMDKPHQLHRETLQFVLNWPTFPELHQDRRLGYQNRTFMDNYSKILLHRLDSLPISQSNNSVKALKEAHSLQQGTQ